MMPRWFWEGAIVWSLAGVGFVGILRPWREPPRPKHRATRWHGQPSHVRRVPPMEQPRPAPRPELSIENVLAGGTDWELALMRHAERQRRARQWEPGH